MGSPRTVGNTWVVLLGTVVGQCRRWSPVTQPGASPTHPRGGGRLVLVRGAGRGSLFMGYTPYIYIYILITLIINIIIGQI